MFPSPPVPLTSFSLTLRQTLNQWLSPDTPPGHIFNLTIISLVLISSLIFVIQTYPLPTSLYQILSLSNTCILVLFILEYLIRLWCAEQKINYIFSIYSLIDLFIFIPFLLGLLGMGIGFSRNLTWFRILHLLRFMQSKTFVILANGQDGLIVTRIGFTLFSIIFVYSGLIYQIEHSINSQAFRTFFDAVYFCIVTMTTVGFGDITPLSEAGRWITLAMILTGIALIPWQVGELVKYFVKKEQLKIKLECQHCGLLFHDLDAHFCKNCGTPLNSEQLKRAIAPISDTIDPIM